MGWRSSFLIVFLVFGILFSLLYFVNIRDTNELVPIEPRMTPVDAIAIVEQDLKNKDLNYTDARLWFSQFNFTYPDDSHKEPHQANFSEVRAHPELLRIPLIYIDAHDQTEYFVNPYTPEVPNKTYEICLKESGGCIQDPDTIHAISGKLAYRIELVRPIQGYYYVDGMSGEILHVHVFQ